MPKMHRRNAWASPAHEIIRFCQFLALQLTHICLLKVCYNTDAIARGQPDQPAPSIDFLDHVLKVGMMINHMNYLTVTNINCNAHWNIIKLKEIRKSLGHLHKTQPVFINCPNIQLSGEYVAESEI